MAKNIPSIPKALSCDPAPPTIELSADQQVKLLLSHRKALAAQVNLTSLTEELKQRQAEFQAVVNGLVTELKVDPNMFLLDLEKLAFVPR